jgi:hypothetical protein
MSASYNGPERRQPSDFVREQIEFMAEMREHMRNQSKRCDSHALDIVALDSRATSLELTREKTAGVLKTLSVGLPALASVVWALFEMWKYKGQ